MNIYGNNHEGFVTTKEGVNILYKFFLNHISIITDLFKSPACVEELALHTILINENGDFANINYGSCYTDNNPDPNSGLYIHKVDR